MRKTFKNEKGITLIALVITIVVLLILAGVALSMVAGNEGILSKAETAVNETEIAGAKEQTEIMLAELSADYYEKKFVDKTETGTLVNYIKNALATAKPTSNGEFSVSIDESGNVSVTDKDGNPVVSGTLDENGKIIWDESSGGNGSGGEVSVGETYYGDSTVTPTDQKYFTFTINEDGETATITGVKDEYAVKTYYKNNGTDVYNCAIIDNGTYITDIVIPYEYVEGENSYTVSDIGKLAFGPKGVYHYQWEGYRTGAYTKIENMFTSFVLPNTITNIGESAFAYCYKVTNINIPNGIEKIDVATFDGCESLNNIIIPESVTIIEEYAFEECTSLSSINIPESVTSIGNHAFYGCTSLSNINIPEGVTSIGNSAFFGCTSLSSINIPASVTSIGEYAFYGCTSLSSINIPEGVTRIGRSTFSGCTSLSSINIPDSITNIGTYAFRDCTNLSSVTIGDSVTSIGERAFYGCTNLSSINIPESVTSIEDGAFYDTAWYNAQPEGVVYAGKVLYKYKGTMPSNTTITVNEGTKGIADYAFSGCTNLSSINIPESVTSIGYRAFNGCTSLSSINIPASVTSIEGYAFYGWTEEQTINCEILEANKPSGWHAKWDYYNDSTPRKAKLNWGVSM